MHEKFKIVLPRVKCMEELPDFVTPLRKTGKMLDKAVDFFASVLFGLVTPLLAFIFVFVSLFSEFLIRILPRNFVTLLDIDVMESVWYTPDTFSRWAEILFFPLVVLIVTYLVNWRKYLRWKRRYGPENFEDVEKSKLVSPIVATNLIVFALAGANMNEGNRFYIDLSIIIGTLLLIPPVCKLSSFAMLKSKNPSETDNAMWLLAYTGIPVGFCFAWGASLLAIPGYYSSGFFLWIGAVFLFIFSLAEAEGGPGTSDPTTIKTLKKLKSKTSLEDVGSKDFAAVQSILFKPPKPFLIPQGIDFRTLTNTRYPWKGQSNAQTILSLLISHSHKVLLVNFASIIVFVLSPPLIFIWFVCVYWYDPKYIARKMSPLFRQKYDELIEKCEIYYNIKYQEDNPPVISKISVKYDDSLVISSDHFSQPNNILSARFFEQFESYSAKVNELELIREKGIIAEPETPLMVLVNEFGMMNYLVRHIKNIELKYFPQNLPVGGGQVLYDGNQSLEERLNNEISELKQRLEQHEHILNHITTSGDWRFIYSETRTKNALNDIRTCTERLLYSRVRDLGHQLPEGQPQTLGPLIQFLKSGKIADLGVVGSKHANVIREFVNPASHDFTATDGDYLKALDSFVHLVEWHVANPPQAKI
jgi:hypothetical protein